MLEQVIDVVQHGHAVGNPAFGLRAMAEVGGDGVLHGAQRALECVAQALQVSVALCVIRLVGLPAITQAGQGRGEFVNGGR